MHIAFRLDGFSDIITLILVLFIIKTNETLSSKAWANIYTKADDAKLGQIFIQKRMTQSFGKYLFKSV